MAFHHIRGQSENILVDGCTFLEGVFLDFYHTDGTNFSIKNCMFNHGGLSLWESGNSGAIMGGLTGSSGANQVIGNEFGWEVDPGGADGCGYDFENSGDGITFQKNFVHNCAGSTRHFFEIETYGSPTGSGTFSNNRFIRLPKIGMFGQKHAAFTYTNNVDITTPLVPEPEYIFNSSNYTFRIVDNDTSAALYYTTDASLPTENSKRYLGENISLSKTCIINAKGFKNGFLPSVTHTKLWSIDSVGIGSLQQPTKIIRPTFSRTTTKIHNANGNFYNLLARKQSAVKANAIYVSPLSY